MSPTQASTDSISGDATHSAMGLVRSARGPAVVARLLAFLLAVIVVVLTATPWQQAAPASGRVMAYSPDERRQNLEAPIEGRVQKWYVREGAIVKKGDPIVDLTDNDPDILARLETERQAVAARGDASRARVAAVEARIESLEASRHSGVSAADSRIQMATQRVNAAQQAVAMSTASLNTAKLNIERQKQLAAQGLTSQRQLELTELDETRAQTDLERSQVALLAARSEELAIGSDRQKVGADVTAAIADARAVRASADADIANAMAELARMEVRLARQAAMSITAPKDGVILRIIANGQSGEIVKSGDILATLVPDATERAVELWVSGNDMPLVHEGSAARVQFQGWPAVQFSGWPSIAVGTFAGRVAFVDAADNGAGQFRVVIVPGLGSSWPTNANLRQGVRAEGWIQLGRVSLGYELWRQLNGFPPTRAGEAERDKADGKAAGKPDDKGGGK